MPGWRRFWIFGETTVSRARRYSEIFGAVISVNATLYAVAVGQPEPTVEERSIEIKRKEFEHDERAVL